MPTKIEDGFEMPSGGTPSIRPVAQYSSMTPTMILAVIAIVLFAGGLGFVGGMQVNKSSQSNVMNGVPGDNSPVPQQAGSSTNNATAPQESPSSSNNNQQAGPQTNAGTPNTNMNNS